jgi:hypothetical protein
MIDFNSPFSVGLARLYSVHHTLVWKPRDRALDLGSQITGTSAKLGWKPATLRDLALSHHLRHPPTRPTHRLAVCSHDWKLPETQVD